MITFALLVPLLLAAPAGPTPERPRLVVMGVDAAQGVAQADADGLAEAIVVALSEREAFRVLSSRDVSELLGVERQKQLLGLCHDDQGCANGLGNALDARFIMRGTLSPAGSGFQLTLKTLDVTNSLPVGRSLRIAPSLEALRKALPAVVAEATGLPAPPGPSLVGPIALTGAGVALLVAGGGLGFSALTREAVAASEFERGLQGSSPLRSQDYYRAESAVIAREKTVSLVLLVGGVAAVTAGLLLLPRNEATSLALFVSPGGLGLAGAFP